MKINDLATLLHNFGFNVVPCVEKRPYIPLGSSDPYLYQHLKAERLDIERLTESMKNIETEGKDYKVGILPGEIKEGKYKGYNSWAIDIDDPQNIEILSITTEKCKEKGIWFEKSRKGYHLYGISKDKAISEKNHDIKLELFGEGSFIVVYGNFEHDFYELQTKEINTAYQGFKHDIAESKNISVTEKKPLTEIKIGVGYGERNTSAFKLACDYKDKGLSIEETTKLMMDWNRNCSPPLHDRELLSCIKSAYKKPPRIKDDIDKKEELLEQYEVFEKDKKGEPTGSVNCSRLARVILEADSQNYAVTKDNQEIYIYNNSFYEPKGEAIAKERVQHYLNDAKGLNYVKGEVVGYIRNHKYIDREEFNPPANLINLKNGIYDIKTKQLIPHTPDYYFINEIPVNYDPNAKINAIKDFLETILNVEDIKIIQEFFGDCLLRSYPYKKALMCVGETDTGKSQLLSLLGVFLGKKNTSNKTLQELCKDRFAAAELYGKQGNIAADIGQDTVASSNKFLMLTGGDRLDAQRKHQQPFNFDNYAKLVFSCNKIPETENKTDAYFNRWLVIEFSYLIPEEEKIPDFYKTLISEEELSGLLNFAIEGIEKLESQRGYSKHRSLEEVKAFMERGSNPILEFITTYIKPKPEGEVSKDFVYNCYLEFCKFMGYPAKDSNVFSRKFKPLAPMGISEGQTRSSGKVWRGIECEYVQIKATDKQQGALDC